MVNQKEAKITIEEAKDISYEFPKSEEIFINKSDLQIQLEKFKDRISATFSVFDLVAVVSLFSPIFSADFKTIFGIESDRIQAGYVVFAVLITIFILYPRFKYYIVNSFKKSRISADPEKMAENILAQCKIKNN